YSGYLVLRSSDPEQPPAADGGPAQLPRPTIEGGTGLNLQNLFYALQWWVFGGFAVLLWVRLVRDEAAGVRRHGRRESSGIAGLPGDCPGLSASVAVPLWPVSGLTHPCGTAPSGPTHPCGTARRPSGWARERVPGLDRAGARRARRTLERGARRRARP